MIRVTLALMATITALHAAEFYNGQAARAVLGQSSFSSHDSGVAASAMTIQNGYLNVAEQSGLVSVFDLSKIPSVDAEILHRGGETCVLCGFPAVSTIPQAVAAGSSTISMFGKRMAAIDVRTHQILVWHDVTSPSASAGPDLRLNVADPDVAAVNESTIIDPISVAVDGQRLFVGDAALHRVLVWKSMPTAANQPADVVLGQPDFSAQEAAGAPRANTINHPDALISDGVNLYVGDSVDRRVLVFSAGDHFLSSDLILNSGTLAAGSFAPGTLVTIRGSNFAAQSIAAPDDTPTPLPTVLGGTEVYLNGVSLPLLFVSPGEIRVQFPYSIPASGSGSLYVRSQRQDGSVSVTSAAAVTFSSASPGIFGFDGQEPRPGILLHGREQREGGSPVTTESPAMPSEVVSICVTGLHATGITSEQLPTAGLPFAGGDLAFTPIHALVNGQPAEVVNVELPPTSIGVYQVQVLLPQTMTGSQAELSISQDGYTSNTVTFPSQKP